MTVTIDIPDDRFLEFAQLFDGFLHGAEQVHDDEELLSVRDLAGLFGLKTPSSLYASKRYALPPDDLCIKKGKTRLWKKSDVREHLIKVGLAGRLCNDAI